MLMKEKKMMHATQEVTFKLINNSGKPIDRITIKNNWKDFDEHPVSGIENQKGRIIQLETRYPLNLSFEGKFLDGGIFHYDFKYGVLQNNEMAFSIDPNGEFHSR